MPFILAIIIIDCLVFFSNYNADTWLIGWDNVMPEFNLALNFKRALFALWQDYRGLGLVDGMAHSANLLHTFYIAALAPFFPDNMLRYIFIMLTHVLGGIGFYVLLHKLTKHKISAFLGALFYMFNIGVIQMYFAPLEVFAMHFTALPWITLTLLQALEQPTYKRLGIFFLCSFLCTPQAFVPTVFIAFSILFGFILLHDLLSKHDFKKILLIGFLFFIANSYWLIPYIYSVKYSAPEIPKTKINQYASGEIFYRNKEFGSLGNVLMLKGFMLNTPEIDTKTNTYVQFLDVWRVHSNSRSYTLVYSVLLIVIAIGAVTALVKKQSVLIPFGLTLSVAFFFLANDTFILETLNEYIRSAFPLLGEAFRFPFTKFITVYAYCLAIFFAYGLYALFQIFERKYVVKYGLLSIFSLLLLFVAYPIFNGQFYSPLLRLKVPHEYFKTISYFNTLDSTKRIALLPVETFWNWEYRNWGHRGSGFWWYGLEQPILIRPFDPWSRANEQFYNELHYAIEQSNPDLFDIVLQKYSVDYLIVDKSILNAGKPKAIDYEKLEKFLSYSLLATREKSFGFIDIYRIDIAPAQKDVRILKDPPRINPVSQFHYEDSAYIRYGDYITTATEPDTIFPFTGLFTEKTQNDLEISIAETSNFIHISPKEPLTVNTSPATYSLFIPSNTVDSVIPVQVKFAKEKVILTEVQPQISVDGRTYESPNRQIELSLSQIESPQYVEITETGQIAANGEYLLLHTEFYNTLKIIEGNESELTSVDTTPLHRYPSTEQIPLSQNSNLQIFIPKINTDNDNNLIENKKFSALNNKSLIQDKSGITVASDKTYSEIVYWNPQMHHSASYLMLVSSTWKSGLPLTFYIDNPYAKQPAIDTLISMQKESTNIFILPPTDVYYSGYGMHFIAKTIGNTTSKTTLHSFRTFYLPFHFLRTLRFEKTLVDETPQLTDIPNSVMHTSPFVYTVNTASKMNDVLYIDQKYADGWVAFYNCTFWIFNCSHLEHIKINNWANGWKLPKDKSSTSYTILFWPQYLEYLGLFSIIITFIVFLIVVIRRADRSTLSALPEYMKQNSKRTLSLLKDEV